MPDPTENQPHPDSPLARSSLGRLVDSISQRGRHPRPVRPVTVRTVCLLTLVLAVLIFLATLLVQLPVHLGVGIAVVFLGIVSGWAQLSFSVNPSPARSRRRQVVSIVAIFLSITVTVLGIMFVFLGVVPFSNIGWGILAGFMIVLAIAIIVEPWWMTLLSDLGEQRMKASEEGLRAEIASHLHDSVLQTLALIQLNSGDADRVRALAHGQERDLREWLYGEPGLTPMSAGLAEYQQFGGARTAADQVGGVDSAELRAGAESGDSSSVENSLTGLPAETEVGSQPAVAADAASVGWPSAQRSPAVAPGRSLAAELRRRAAIVEDSLGKVIEVVTVGDIPYSERLVPLADASREALLNAAAHGREPISLYLEVQGSLVEVFVRDHGDGFDVQHLPEGHFGVAQSIVGRLNRTGGAAQIVSRPDWGTEVHLSLRLVLGNEFGSNMDLAAQAEEQPVAPAALPVTQSVKPLSGSVCLPDQGRVALPPEQGAKSPVDGSQSPARSVQAVDQGTEAIQDQQQDREGELA